MPITRPKGNSEFSIALPALHPGQKAVLAAARRVNFVCAGRGWRKSTLGVHLVVDYAMRRKRQVLWTAFTSAPITTIQTDHFKTVFGEMWYQFYDSTKGILQPPGWAPTFFRSLEDPDATRGVTPGLIINDEMGALGRGIYRSVLAAAAFKSKGDFWGFGTPNPADPYNDFYNNVTAPATDYRIGHVLPVVGAKVIDGKLVRKPHPYENPFYTFEELEQFWNDCVTEADRVRFRIELLCEFLRDEGSQIEDPEKACILPYTEGDLANEWFLEGYRPDPLGWYQSGGDLAVMKDRIAIGTIDRNTNKQVYMRHFTPTAHTPEGRWEQLYDALERCNKLFPGTFKVDVTGMGLSVPSTMRKRGVVLEPINFGGGSGKKVAMYDHMSSVIEGRKCALFNHPTLVDELQNLKRKKMANSTQIKGAGDFDDLCTMTALMLDGIEGGKVVMEEEKPVEIWQPKIEVNPFAMVGGVW